MMDRRRKPLDARAMERAINQIRGVYAAQVIAGGSDMIDEIHVIASPLRKPKQVVRDIESMLLVNFGVRVDYRRISLVQMQEERLFQAEGRPRLVTVRVVDGAHRRAEVELERGGRVYVGTAQSASEDVPMERLVATATLEAVKQILGERVEYTVDAVNRISVNGMPAIIVAVGVQFQTGSERLLGVCQIHTEENDAAARAALSAVNRRLLVARKEPA